jgi:succinate-acetate transporter protein
MATLIVWAVFSTVMYVAAVKVRAAYEELDQ